MPRKRLTLGKLRQALLRGVHPKDLGFRVLGWGSFRVAYTKDGWVVKEHMGPAFGTPEGELRKLCPKVRIAKQTRAGCWAIQRRYSHIRHLTAADRRILSACDNAVDNDYQRSNLGRLPSGRLVAFDL